jgi:hypothetical protein
MDELKEFFSGWPVWEVANFIVLIMIWFSVSSSDSKIGEVKDEIESWRKSQEKGDA